ncbi:MAG TPA: transporter associated domain-containing protein, partial [Pyrinomonadaceae bacterium]|nr:transporter associated domain-containing protein [Pyrinomonadaceae bacterium]
LLDGGLAVRDLNRRLNLQLPESEAYTTIAGFLMTEAGHVLEPGEVVKHDGLLFQIESVEGRRIASVRLEKVEQPEKIEENGNNGNGQVNS